MGYVVAALALAVLGLAMWLIRLSGQRAEEREGRLAAERGVDAFKTAKEIVEANKADETGRLEAVVKRYRDDLKKYEREAANLSPATRQQRLKELGQLLDIVPAPAGVPAPVPPKKGKT